MWSPSSRPTRRTPSGKGRAAAIRFESRSTSQETYRRPTLFSPRGRRSAPRLPGLGPVPSFARSEGFFHVVRRGAVRNTGRATQHRQHREADAGPLRPRALPAARRDGFRAGPAGGGRCRGRGAAGGTSAYFGDRGRGGARAPAVRRGRRAALARHRRRRRPVAARAGRLRRGRGAGGGGRGAAGAVSQPARGARRARDLVGGVAGRGARDLLPCRGAGGLAAARVRVRGRGGRRRAGVRDRGAPGPGARVHGDLAAGRRSR